jgi:hypothetical protein
MKHGPHPCKVSKPVTIIVRLVLSTRVQLKKMKIVHLKSFYIYQLCHESRSSINIFGGLTDQNIYIA